MNRSIFITGISGTGKSTICEELARRGYKSYDIEDVDDLFAMYDKKTKKKFVGDNFDQSLENVQKYNWLCDIDKLRSLIKDNSDGIVFYCGVGLNMDEIVPLFDNVIMLTASNNTLRDRLSTRTSNDYGKTADVQDWIFSWKDWWEDSIKAYKPVIIDADKGLDEVVAEIVNVARQ